MIGLAFRMFDPDHLLGDKVDLGITCALLPRVAIGGAICLVAAIVFRLHLPALRGEARQLIVAQGLGAGEPPQEITGPGDQVPLRAAGH